jgi:hypothetical protein
MLVQIKALGSITAQGSIDFPYLYIVKQKKSSFKKKKRARA